MELYVLMYRSVQLDILYKRNILYILENYLITSSGIWSTGKLKKNTIYERIYVQNILFNSDILIFSILSFAAKNVSNESWRDIGILFLKNIILLQWKLFHNFFYKICFSYSISKFNLMNHFTYNKLDSKRIFKITNVHQWIPIITINPPIRDVLCC